MADLVVEDLCKSYGAAIAVDRIGFEVADGEFVTLLGPSGCGKSTTLSCIAGLETPDSGRIRSGSTVFFDSAQRRLLPAEKRNCGLVFQAYALWPHMTVRENLAFPLALRKLPAAVREKRIGEVLDLVEMGSYADRYPYQLSGGQQQRVALARTLVYEPSVLLLDEPLSNLDAKLRERARSWLGQLRSRVRLTTVYVTHDQTEALALSDRIVVMDRGRIAQIGTPREIYEKPQDPFVADFIGTSSFFHGTLQSLPAASDGAAVIRLADGQELAAALSWPLRAGTQVAVAVRPERLTVLPGDRPMPSERGTVLPGRVTARSYLGARYQYEIEVGGTIAKTESPADIADPAVRVWIPSNGCVVFDAARVTHSARLAASRHEGIPA